jgi:hypothetical protein
MIEGQGEEEDIPKKRERENIDAALVTLTQLAASRDEGYDEDDENEPENENVVEDENEPVDHGVSGPPAAAK